MISWSNTKEAFIQEEFFIEWLDAQPSANCIDVEFSPNKIELKRVSISMFLEQDILYFPFTFCNRQVIILRDDVEWLK